MRSAAAAAAASVRRPRLGSRGTLAARPAARAGLRRRGGRWARYLLLLGPLVALTCCSCGGSSAPPPPPRRPGAAGTPHWPGVVAPAPSRPPSAPPSAPPSGPGQPAGPWRSPPPSPPAPPFPQPRISIGVSDPALISEPASVQVTQLSAMRTAGITAVRLEADWASVQSGGPREFAWGPLDQVVRLAISAGMSVDLVIDGCPRWAAVAAAAGDPWPEPSSAAQYGEWAAEVAARYGPAGVRDFEIWNEPNDIAFWQPAPNPHAYTEDLIAAYRGIKRADPAAFVISGGLAPEVTTGGNYNAIEFLRDMYRYGAQGHFDALGYHPYSYPALPSSYEPWSGWSQMAQTDPSLRRTMTNAGDGGKPVWITEVGAPSAGPQGVGAATQAMEITEAIRTARATSWIGALYIYSWQDVGTSASNSQDWFGVVSATGTRKPAYWALASAIP
jgi:polysaccharide biosynthesis protein PslG